MLKLSVALGVPFHEVRSWSCAELALYRAFFQVAPFGEDAENFRHALRQRDFINSNRKPGSQIRELDQFMPFKPARPDKGIGELKNQFRHLAARGLAKRTK